RAEANGFLSEFLVQPSSTVAKGDALVRCVNPMSVAQVRGAQARVAEWEAVYASEVTNDRTKAEVAKERLAHEKAALAAVIQRADELIVRAKTDGVFIVP